MAILVCLGRTPNIHLVLHFEGFCPLWGPRMLHNKLVGARPGAGMWLSSVQVVSVCPIVLQGLRGSFFFVRVVRITRVSGWRSLSKPVLAWFMSASRVISPDGVVASTLEAWICGRSWGGRGKALIRQLSGRSLPSQGAARPLGRSP